MGRERKRERKNEQNLEKRKMKEAAVLFKRTTVREREK